MCFHVDFHFQRISYSRQTLLMALYWQDYMSKITSNPRRIVDGQGVDYIITTTWEVRRQIGIEFSSYMCHSPFTFPR